MGKLDGKVVIVTGGAQGIGAATAKLFAEEGATVFIGDMNLSAGINTAIEINNALPKNAVGKAMFHLLDVTDLASIDTFVAKANSLGHIDVLVNNAGITRDKMFLKMPREDFMKVFGVNLFGLADMTRAVAPLMVAQSSGVILNASSVVAENGNIGQSNYATSKGAVVTFTETLSKELGRKGIRVNAVAPGFTDTPMVAAMTEDARARTAAMIPLGRLGKSEEIAEAYLYLATALYVTGTTLAIDGGLVI